MPQFLIGLFAFTLVASAQTATSSPTPTLSNAVGTLSGSGNMTLDGTPLANGVPSWPVMAGDQIAIGSSPAIITLSDGSQLSLTANSNITLIINNGFVEVIVKSGSIQNHGNNFVRDWCWYAPAKTSHFRCDGNKGPAQADRRCCPWF